MKAREIKDLLDIKYHQFNDLAFIENDPISIPHRYKSLGDIEISGFLAATLAWGQRPVIIKNANLLMELMDDSPDAFIRGFTAKDLKPFRNFKHRTFNSIDCTTFLNALQKLLLQFNGLESAFFDEKSVKNNDLNVLISRFRLRFLSFPHQSRTEKHLADPMSGSAAKRINMFLRWMVRKDAAGVDFGIWNKIKMSQLMLPLDVHSGRVARELGLLKRNQNDWKAVEEVTTALRLFDQNDPVKYDFAIFGMGVTEKF